MDQDYKQKEWFSRLDEPMRRLVEQSGDLLEREKREETEPLEASFAGSYGGPKDYSFVVFPIAKAYEGFLKKFLWEAGLIREYQYKGRNFRIGRSLNPDLPEKYRDEDWLYDDLVRLCGRCGDPALAARVWEAWSRGRNRIFHYFMDNQGDVSLTEAEERVALLMEVMERVGRCKSAE